MMTIERHPNFPHKIGNIAKLVFLLRITSSSFASYSFSSNSSAAAAMRVHPGSSSPNGVDGVATNGSDVASASANGSNGSTATATNGNGELRTAAPAVAASAVAVEADLYRKKVRLHFTQI